MTRHLVVTACLSLAIACATSFAAAPGGPTTAPAAPDIAASESDALPPVPPPLDDSAIVAPVAEPTSKPTPQPANPVYDGPIVPPPLDTGTVFVAPPTITPKATATTPPAVIPAAPRPPNVNPLPSIKLQYDEHNFTMNAPGLAWTARPDDALQPGAVVSYLREFPTVGFTVISEPVGVAATLSLDELEKVVADNLRRGGARQVELVDRKPVTLNGMAGAQLDFHAPIDRANLSYRFWVYSGNGYMYQLIGHSLVADERRMRQVIEPMVSSFRQIDPKRVIQTPGFEPLARFQSPRYGYVIDLKDDPLWRRWTAVTDEVPSAEVGALLGNDTAMVVIPVSFVVDAPEDETLAPVMLRLLDMEWEKVRGLRRINEGKLSGFACDYVRDLNGTRWEYRLKVLRGDGFGYLAAAWTGKPDRVKTLPLLLDRVTRPGVDPVRPDVKSLTAEERKSHALILSEIGLHYFYEKAYERAIRYFQTCSPLDPQNDVIRANEVQALIMQSKFEKGIEVARKHLADCPDRPVLLCKLATCLDNTAKDDEAIALYRKAFAGDYQNDFQFENYVVMLMEAEKFDDALTAVEAYRKHATDVSFLLLQARILARLERHDQAIALLQQQQSETGFNVEIASALAERYADAERYNESLDIAKQLLDAGHSSAYTHFLRGQALTGLKSYGPAKESLETALNKEPDFPRATELLRHVSGMLGQGEGFAVREVIEPVAVPDSILNAPAPATQPAFLSDQAGVYRLRMRAISFQRGKPITETNFRRIEILNRQGVEEFSTMQLDFDPLVEQLYVNKLEVRDPAGKLLSSGKPADYFLVDDRSASGTASTQRTLNLPVPGLKPGCVVELIYTRRELASSRQFRFDNWFFANPLPVARSVYYVTGDVDALKWVAKRIPEPQKLDRALCWSVTWPELFKPEPMAVEATRFLPFLAVSDSSINWADEAKQFIDSISDRLPCDEQVKQLATELTADLDQPTARIDAILKHVQHDYTYKAIEFGRRARVPQKAPDFVHNRYGDCKDHSLLLCQLLQSAGIDARLALVRSYGQVFEDIPSLDQFDHMIVYAPQLKRFFDCTDKDADLAPGVPFGLSGQRALVLDPDKPAAFITIPPYPDDCSQLSTRRQLQIVGEGDLDATETISATGACARYLRAIMRAGAPRDRVRTLQNLFSPYADLTVRDVQLRNLDDLRRPFIIEAKLLIRRCFARDGADPRLAGHIPALWERFYGRAEHVDARQSPFEINYPYKLRSTFELTLPPGARLDTPPADAGATTPFASISTKYTASPTQLKAESTFHFTPAEHPAADYDRYEQSQDRLLSSLEPRIVLQSPPPAPAN